MLYFAYGSNLLTERLAARCPTARPAAPATLAGHAVRFAKYSWIDGSGKATIRAEADARTQGLLFEISAADQDALDRIEGAGKGYDRWDGLTVETAQGTALATTYIASDPREALVPFDWYLALILAGAAQHGLAETHAQIAGTAWEVDPQPDRPGRQAAIAALRAAGHDDWPGLLDRHGSSDGFDVAMQKP